MLGRLIWAGLALLLGWVVLRALREQSAPQQGGAGEQPPTWTYQPPVAEAPAAAAVVEAAAPAVTEAPVAPAVPAAPAVAEAPAAAAPATTEIYCVRCKERRDVPNATEERTANGRRAARGICPVCGAKVFTFLREQESTETTA